MADANPIKCPLNLPGQVRALHQSVHAVRWGDYVPRDLVRRQARWQKQVKNNQAPMTASPIPAHAVFEAIIKR